MLIIRHLFYYSEEIYLHILILIYRNTKTMDFFLANYICIMNQAACYYIVSMTKLGYT